MSKKPNKNSTKDGKVVWVLLASLLILAAVVLLVWLLAGNGNNSGTGKPTGGQTQTYPIKVEDTEKVNINLGYGMQLVDVGRYSGIYMEDGSNDIVTNMLMILVENQGTQDIQYAEIEVPVGDKTAYFKMSTLPVGEAIVLLEQNRMRYIGEKVSLAISQNVVLFDEPMDLCEDKLKIQARDGVINITNISGEDIQGNVVVYYKNHAAAKLYGGVTYRCVVEGGIKKGEIKQIQAQHYDSSISRIMFVTIGN